MNRRLAATIGFIVAAGMLAACGSSSDDDSSASSSATASQSAPDGSSEPSATQPGGSATPPAESSAADASASPDPSEAPFAANTSPDTEQAGVNAQLVLVDIRSAKHSGYDRVVLEFSGTGTPGWTAQYADAASRQGSGEAITVPGKALLDVNVTGSAIPAEGQPTVNAGSITPSGTSTITGIFNDGTFEGITHVVLGTSGEQPFRVFAVANPPRVVIDVQS